VNAAHRCLLLALVLLAGVPASASAAPLPPQGVYEGCSPGTTGGEAQVCVERLRKIRAAGFVIVLNYSALYGSPEQVQNYARAANELGIRLIWPLHHRDLYSKPDVSSTFIAMSEACGCSSPAALIPFMIGVVRDLPATYMYYVGDETPLEMHDAMAANSRLVAQTDPTHPRFYVSMELSSFGANLRPFAEDADVLAGDTYPIGASDRVEDVADATCAVQRIADAHLRPSAMVLQSFSWGPDFETLPERWPTSDEYRTMRDLALTNGRPRFILWWAAYVIFRSDQPDARWAALVNGAMAPAPADLAAPPPAPAVARKARRPQRAPKVRRLSATRRGRVVKVRFALTAAAPTAIAARSGRCLRERRVHGRVALRTVKVRLAPRASKVVLRVTPLGGRSVRLRVKQRLKRRSGGHQGAGARAVR
jgi:hypothetical protein